MEIKKAVDIDFKETVFESPLRVAIILENNRYVNQLLKAGASQKKNKNPQRKTIFEEVAEFRKNLTKLKILLKEMKN